jgi:hypothetical protein
MENIRYYDVSYKITDACIDEEMEENIKYIMDATGWTKEYVINSALQLGCKWHLKDQLNSIADYQLGEKSRKL